MSISSSHTKAFSSVIVVGAGPAGATIAYELARRGIDVLILERSKVPRCQLCGGVTWKAARQLPFDISPVVQRTVRQLTLLRNGSPKLTIRSDLCQMIRGEKNSSAAARSFGPLQPLFDLARRFIVPQHQLQIG